MDAERQSRVKEVFEAASGRSLEETAGESKSDAEDLPQSIGRYRIVSLLGEGGMGRVYEAEDSELKRRVALKVLTPKLAGDSKFLSRFKREAQAVAALNHPNVVTLHSVEESDGTHFLTMELVGGSPLSRLIPEEGFELTELLEKAIPLVEGLRAAHERGIVHRDLKPGNVMVDDEGRVKILDFGLARMHSTLGEGGSQEATMSALTVHGAIVGTVVPYMSPEQVSGQPVDRRSDIFSLGVILYEMCTGDRPFAGETATHTMSAILRDHPALVNEIRSDLPEHLGRIVRRCLEKEPANRYQTIQMVRDELEELKREAASGQTELKKVPLGWPLFSWGRIGLVVILGAIVFVMFILYWSGRGQDVGRGEPLRAESTAALDRKMIVVLPFENLGLPEDEYFAAGMTEEITSRLGSVSGLGVISRKGALRYAGTDKSSREIGAELGVAHILRGTVRWAGGGKGAGRVRITPALIRAADDHQLWSQPYERVIEDIFEVQSDIAGQVIERLGVVLLEGEGMSLRARPTENLEAYTLYLKGRHFWNKRTAKNIQTGLSFFQQAVDLDPSYALAHVGIADTWIFRGWYSVLAPREAFPKAKQAALNALQFDATLAAAHTSRAHIYLEFDHDWEAAEEEYLRAIELDSRYPTAHHWYGGYLSAMGRHDEALQQAEKARELDPLSPIINTWIGLRHYFAGRYQVAIEEYEKALELYPDFAPGHWHFGWALEQVGRYEESIAAAQKAVELSGGNPLYIASLGHAYAVSGDDKAARRILFQLQQESAARHVSAYHTAVIHGALGDVEAAFQRLEGAFEERSPWIGYMKVDPRLEPLHSDSRFTDLLQRAKLE